MSVVLCWFGSYPIPQNLFLTMAHKIVHLRSEWAGVGRIRTIAGEFIRVITAAINGFNRLTPVSIQVTSGIMRLTYAAGSTYSIDARIDLWGAADVAANNTYTVKVSGPNWIDVETTLPDGAISVTGITTSYSRIPWKIEATTTGRILISPQAPDKANDFRVMITDTGVNFAYVSMMSEATGFNPGEFDPIVIPTGNWAGTDMTANKGIGFLKSGLTSDTAATARQWMLITDGETLYWGAAYNHETAPLQIQAFGGYQNDEVGVTTRGFLFGTFTVSYTSYSAHGNLLTNSQMDGACWLLRNETRTTYRVVNRGWNTAFHSNAGIMGSNSSAMAYPSPYFKNINLGEALLFNGADARIYGTLPGLFAPQERVNTIFTGFTYVPGENNLNGKKLWAVPSTFYSDTTFTISTGYAFFDLTGPWK